MFFFRAIVPATLAVASLANALSLGHSNHIARSSHKNVCRDSTNATNTTNVQGGTSQKVGIVYTGDSSSLINTLKGPHSKYFYNWRPTVPSEAKNAGFQVCSTLWGSKYVSTFAQVSTQYPCVIGFNEVNLASQANLSPQDAANIWNAQIGPLAAKGIELIGPSVTTAPDGFQWMKDFFSLCSNSFGAHCGAGALNLHYYGTDSKDFIAYMTKFYKQFGLPIMVTEFACTDFSNTAANPTPAEVRQWMAEVINWMESTSWIVAYFAFGLTDGDLWGVSENARLLASGTSLNSLGSSYINVDWS